MKSAHIRLLTLLCLLLTLAGVSLAGLTLLPAPAAAKAPAMEAFDRIVPGLTRAEDLPALGFDTDHARTLPTATLATRLAGDPDKSARDCLAARQYCSGYLLHPAPAADILLLVMDGRVMHKTVARL